MPYSYTKPNGTRKLEFWKTYRGGERHEFISVPEDWSIEEIQTELEDWCAFHMHNSDFMRYGWNDEQDWGSRI